MGGYKRIEYQNIMELCPHRGGTWHRTFPIVSISGTYAMQFPPIDTNSFTIILRCA